MKNKAVRLIILCLSVATLHACNTGEDPIGKVLFKAFRNPVLKEITPEQVAPVLEEKLQQHDRKHTELIAAYYQKHQFSPVLLKKHLKTGGIDALLERIEQADMHGLDPGLFQPENLRRLKDSLENKDAVSSPGEATPLVADLELQIASSLAAYGHALLYGHTNPADVFPRYYTETKRPDSTSLSRLYETNDLKALLDSIQPSDDSYKAIQNALSEISGTDSANVARRQALIVNLERLRWQNKPDAKKYVLVNIPDFRLHVMENGQSVKTMKVCVGETTRRWQTPQLNSLIERVQVNPIWHIPKSIAANEIIKKAAADPYYLENTNIDVYENGEKVADSRDIKWEKVSEEEMPYSFKQRPGSRNALGKIKFLFENQSSVYLHDTPAKAAFDQDMRAVSHGCVRVEKPLELAEALFGPGEKFELIKTEMGKQDPTAQNVELPEPVPVYLSYATAWLEDGHIRYSPDIYGLNSLVINQLQATDTSLLSAR